MDPLTLSLIASGAQAAAGLGKTAFGLSQKARGKQALAAAYEAPTGKPSEYAELLKQARASDLAQRRIDEINRSMATSTAALQQAGARGIIGGIGAVTEAGSRAKTGVLSQQQAEIMRALERGTIGAERERARQINRQMREEGFAMQGIESGIANIAGGLGDVVSAGISAAEAGSKLKPKKKSPVSESLVSTAEAVEGTIDDPNYFPTEEEMVFPEIKFKKGGVQKTPGAFSHKTNPINIMKDGAKIGEMTGGEYIFNPKQAKQMKKLASSGDTDLHKFVKSLLNKPQFK